jgi:hypothetical protein
MVRTQIQLEDRQAEMLRKLSEEGGLSMAEIIRRSIDLYLASIPPKPGREEQRERAIRAPGRFRSGVHDLGESHDRYLQEALGR